MEGPGRKPAAGPQLPATVAPPHARGAQRSTSSQTQAAPMLPELASPHAPTAGSAPVPPNGSSASCRQLPSVLSLPSVSHTAGRAGQAAGGGRGGRGPSSSPTRQSMAAQRGGRHSSQASWACGSRWQAGALPPCRASPVKLSTKKPSSAGPCSSAAGPSSRRACSSSAMHCLQGGGDAGKRGPGASLRPPGSPPSQRLAACGSLQRAPCKPAPGPHPRTFPPAVHRCTGEKGAACRSCRGPAHTPAVPPPPPAGPGAVG